jgi:hypothetical protein
MSLTEELARIRMAEARKAADQVVRQNQLKLAEEKHHPLRRVILAIVTTAKDAAAGSAGRLRRLKSLTDGHRTAKQL